MNPALLPRPRKSDLPPHEAVLAVAMAAIQWYGKQDRHIPIPTKFSTMIASRVDNGIRPKEVDDVILQLPAGRGTFVIAARTVPLTHDEALLCEVNRDGELDISILPMVDGKADIDHLPVMRDAQRIEGAKDICGVVLSL
jgi:hypothetical protein